MRSDTDLDPASLSMTEAANHLAHGEISAEEYARSLLAAISARQELNAFVTVRDDAVLDAAKKADAAFAHGEILGPLHGIPIAVKDNIDTADLPTTGGTPALRNHQPAADAPVVRSLRGAGAIVLGKTNLHELAYGITGDNATYGSTANPYDTRLAAGGSSGGTAAAVAARLAPAGLGTDTGGSVRVPAALCGVAGFRPTVGRYSAAGIITVSRTRDTVGTMARTVADLMLLDSALAGDRCQRTVFADDLAALSSWRLGVIRHPFFDGLAPDLATLFENRLTSLRDHGATVVEVNAPAGLDRIMELVGFSIAFYETPRDLPAYLTHHGLKLSFSDVVNRCANPDVREILSGIVGTSAIPESVYRAALQRHRPALAAMVQSILTEHALTAIAWPTTPLTAVPPWTDKVELGGETVPAFPTVTRTTGIGSSIGFPGVTIPAGFDDAGLPIGFALDGAPGSDRNLLAMANSCERLFGHLPPPGMPR